MYLTHEAAREHQQTMLTTATEERLRLRVRALHRTTRRAQRAQRQAQRAQRQAQRAQRQVLRAQRDAAQLRAELAAEQHS